MRFKPTLSQRRKALDTLEKRLALVQKLTSAILSAIRSAVPDAGSLDQAEGLSLNGCGQLTGSDDEGKETLLGAKF